MKTIFIDGKSGTTGLRIYERLSAREDIKIITLSEEDRKKTECRKEALNSCDIAFLCLPDDASREAVGLIENPDVTVIDTSTAHRTEAGWAYGFPELDESFFTNIKNGKRIAVPGCHASGFIALVYPLIKAGIISPEARIICNSVTGYSGGGKKMIAEYEVENLPESYLAPRQYGINQNHKHLREMQKVTGLKTPPVFCPIVSDFYSGMEVTVPLFAEDIKGFTAEDIKKVYSEKYKGLIVSYQNIMDDNGYIPANKYSGLDSFHITVCGNEERIMLIAAYDNLGKGASGAAVECLNIVIGENNTKGLDLQLEIH
jgi:N-acetyl-gamma-glutamyl-phosphate reductase